MKIKKVMRLYAGGDWECSLCHSEPWNHYAFIMKDGSVQYICKNCVEKSKLTDEIRKIEQIGRRK